MKKKSIIWLVAAFCLGAFLFTSPALAAEPKLESSTISPGGAVDLKGGPYTLQDLKGQPAAGESTSADGTIQIGTGGIYTTAPVEEGAKAAAPPPGTVLLDITRDGSNIKITWEATCVEPQIFVHPGNGSGQFTNDPNEWVQVTHVIGNVWQVHPDLTTLFEIKVDPADPNKITLIHKNQVGTGNGEVYYRALKKGETDKDGKLPTAWAVGKVNVTLHLDWNLISPTVFKPTLNETLGTSFSNNEQIWKWNADKQQFEQPATFTNGAWAFPQGSAWNNINNGEGYGINILSLPEGKDSKIITIVGQVINVSFNLTVKKDWNKFGCPFPYPTKLNTGSGFTKDVCKPNDQVWMWVWDSAAKGHFDAPSAFDGMKWSPDFELKPGVGYGYNHLGNGFNWSGNKPL